MQLDHPLTRASLQCPLCRGHKPESQLACWPCYSRTGLKYGNASATGLIDAYERRLALRMAEERAERRAEDWSY